MNTFKLPQEVIEIIHKFQENKFEIYIVGGAVRDLLMKRNVIDWDFTTNATPQEIQKIFPNSFYENNFGTVGIEPKNSDFKPHEITTFRKEFGYSDFRRPDKIEWGKSIYDDLSRRDFTINSIALLLKNDNLNGECDFEIIDPYNGQKDILDKKIKSVGDANERFKEDALRMMRAVRFHTQLNFNIEEKTLQAIKEMNQNLEKIAKERIKDELWKILAAPKASDGIMTLYDAKLLEIFLPELVEAFKVDQVSPQRHHIYDVGTHLIMSLKACESNDPLLKFAVLLHDIGKIKTYKKQENGVVTFYNHEVVGSKMCSIIANRLRLSKKEKEKLMRLVRWHQFTVNEHQTDSALRRFIVNVGVDNIDDILELRRSDRIGSGARETSWRTEEFKKRLIDVQKQPFSVHDLKITGNDIMEILKLKPSQKVGEILNLIFEEVVENKLPNEREILLSKVRTYNK